MTAPARGTAHAAAWALMLGNFVVGLAVVAPAGMLRPIADDLSVSIRDAGLLVTLGAVVLCIGSPLVAWATNAMGRRALMAGTLALLALCHAASGFAPDYATLLILRLVTMAVAAVYTPLAASTIGLIVPEHERASRISFVFLGWSLALAFGLPLATFIAEFVGWRATMAVQGVAAAASFVLLWAGLPNGLRGAALSLASWGAIARNPRIHLLLLVTLLWNAGLYSVFPYLVPLLGSLAGAGAQTAAVLFGTMGVLGFVGNVAATRGVGTLGPYRTALASTACLAMGGLAWAFGAGVLPAMASTMVLWGLGFAATHSMIQARLVAAAPPLASATVALNTSWLYIGQAIGAGLGGELFAREALLTMGYAAAVFMVACFVTAALTRDS